MEFDHQNIHKARAVYYGLFANLFPFSFGIEQFEQLQPTLDLLYRNPLDERSERALLNLVRRLKNRGYIPLRQENERLFSRPDTGPIPMTASFICEQRDDGEKRLRMIEYLQTTAYRRNSDEYKEHEDHIEFICRFLQQLTIELFEGDTAAEKLNRTVFQNVLNEMIDPFINQLLHHRYSSFYRQAAVVLQSFIAFERVFLDVGTVGPSPRPSSGRKHVGTDQGQTTGGCVRMGQDSCV